MRKIVVTEFLSLDNVMESPHEWHFPFFDDEAGRSARPARYCSVGRPTRCSRVPGPSGAGT